MHDANIRVAIAGAGGRMGRQLIQAALALEGVQLGAALEHVYERATLRINGNVAPASHGETVEAILGDGNAALANQRFQLNQAPLTYTSASTPSGRKPASIAITMPV